MFLLEEKKIEQLENSIAKEKVQGKIIIFLHLTKDFSPSNNKNLYLLLVLYMNLRKSIFEKKGNITETKSSYNLEESFHNKRIDEVETTTAESIRKSNFQNFN